MEQGNYETNTLLCLLVLAALVGCSKKSAPPPAVSGIPAGQPFRDLRELPGTVADITLTSNTIRIDETTTRRILNSVGSDGNIFVFDDSDQRIQNLHEGQILFLENVAVQKVLSIARKDKLIIVGTDYASLTDFIQQGHLKWDAPIQFNSLFAEASEPHPSIRSGSSRGGYHRARSTPRAESFPTLEKLTGGIRR